MKVSLSFSRCSGRIPCAGIRLEPVPQERAGSNPACAGRNSALASRPRWVNTGIARGPNEEPSKTRPNQT
jgi:hypothetical protein